MPKDIASKIKTLRNKNNLSQKRFAHKIGVSEKTVSAYENGRAYPSLKVLEKISQTYNADLLKSNSENDRKKKKLEKTLNTLKELLELD